MKPFRQIQSFCRVVGLTLSLWLTAGAGGAQASGPGESTWSDAHTVALWLFDEPQYLNMTLTDAGRNMYDLRLLRGGRMMPGKFGNAVSFSAQRGPAVALPFVSRSPLPHEEAPDKRPRVAYPGLSDVLERGNWTLEFWLRLDRPPRTAATLMELGKGRVVGFHCGLAAGGNGFSLRTAHGLEALCPTDGAALADGQWHHVAFTRDREKNQTRHYLDGRLQTEPSKAPAVIPPAELPGLIGAIFADHKFTQPINLRVAGQIDFHWGETRELVWAERWRGSIESPRSGEAEFFCVAEKPTWGIDPADVKITTEDTPQDGVERALLNIAGQVLLGGPGEKRPGYGKFAMKEGQSYPLQLDFLQNGQASRLRLLWRWPGGDWELIPAEVFSHRPEDRQRAEAEAGAAVEKASYIALGSGWLYSQPLGGAMDELRVSDVVRYSANFGSPSSLSRNWSANPPKPSVASGPPLLLFGTEAAPTPVQLGSRKHVFIDEVMVESRYNVHLKINPPQGGEPTDMVNNKPWENPGPGLFLDGCIYDHDGQVRFNYNNNAMWLTYGNQNDPDRTHVLCMASSRDGLHFEKPNHGQVEWEGNRNNNIILKAPVQGRVFKDTNPNVPPDEIFKFTGFQMQRGIYLFTSPDGIRWRRNETIMYPFDCGGGVETFWDDQRGVYVTLMRHEGWATFHPPFGRAAAMGQTHEITKPWPFRPIANPAHLSKHHSLPSFSHELPTPFEPFPEWVDNPQKFMRTAQIYRTRAVKYEWAPDTYLAFVWRLVGLPPHDVRQTELATSRDGVHWKFFGDPYYLRAGWDFNGEKVQEALSMHGLVRRGDQIWEYANIKTGTHIESTPHDRIFRFIQRLDGFVSLNAGEGKGWVMTHPFIFDGRQLELNIAAEGEVRVAILDEAGNAIPDFLIAECDPIHADSVKHTVTWRGSADVTRLAGRTVRLRFEMRDAKLYAFQFTGAK